jgi:hypothetical protein
MFPVRSCCSSSSASAFAVGTTLYRVSTARRIARDAGMNPDDAAAATLLTPNGLDATYLAASLRAGQQVQAPEKPGTYESMHRHTAEGRLRELADLREKGMITPDEYDERRRAILAEI